ncbi:MAG: DUF368 domain-containing protein [Lentisphaerae bacterium]|nr:DUF368 domain-containing protein [Lentisphaerota bacterium]
MKEKSRFCEDLYNFSVGFCMGGANVIPGVSGGTMLFIMGAFSKLTGAISTIASVKTLKLLLSGKWKELYELIPWRFLFALGVGILLSFATLAKLLVWLLNNCQQYTFAFFFGLIAASIITVNRQMKKWSWGAWISFAASAATAFGIISLVPVNAGSQWYMLILYGAICIIAMILPGLSGSFLLLIFGQYQKVWDAVGNLAHFHWTISDISTVFFLALGAIAGIGMFVHLLNWLIKNFYDFTVAALIGFMVGAIPRLWPWQQEIANHISYNAPIYDISFLWTVLVIFSGLLLVLIIEFFARKKQEGGLTNVSYRS